MCGIAGYFNATAFQPEYLERMCTRLRHRGPDGEGYVYFGTGQAIPISGNDTPGYCRGNAYPWLPQNDRPGESGFFGGFAHRRLAIVDLEASGHQPMCTPDKRFWITYNGELYNYIELKEELKKKGHVFITRSDTEVILNAWLAWGVNCLERFNGMWAFAIYDTIEQKLFASRDRFGVKPFYYYHHADTLLFASEQKALLENPALNTGLNEEAVFDYFVFGQIEYQLEGFFKNIFELLPAHFLIWDKKSRKIAQHAYYQLQYQSGAHQWNLNSFNESVETTRSLLENAIRIRMRADVEVGTCLSGGLDSSAIAGMMRKVSGSEQSLQSFTAVFPGTTIDESRWASMMAKHAGLNENYVSPSLEELSTDLQDLSLCQDIPIWSTSTYAQFRVMRLVKDSGIKVVLDGQGGDELFAGYGQHVYFHQKALPFTERRSTMFSPAQIAFMTRQYLRHELIYQFPVNITSRIFQSYFPELQFLDNDFYLRHQGRFMAMRHTNDPDLNSRLAREMVNTSLKSYLKCEDRCAMWFGVESRTPFSDDHPLIDYVFSLPQSYKIRNGQSKYLLREAIKGVVPESIRLRGDKLGYVTPNNAWLRVLTPLLKETLHDLPGSLFDVQRISKDPGQVLLPKGDTDNGRIFKLLSFASWFQVFKKHLGGS